MILVKIDKSGPCSCCNKNRPIENRTKWLCHECNHFRKHGETTFETAQRKQKEYQERYLEKQKNKEPKPVKVYTIRQQTTKQAKREDELSKLKKKIRQEAIDAEMYYCWGCGDGSQNLDCSHILSVRHRKDLELDKKNINLLCRDCHDKWEQNDLEGMLELMCFEKDLEYIKNNDSKRFNRLLTKLHELYQAIQNKEVFDVKEMVLEKLFKIISNEKFVTLSETIIIR